MSRQRRAERRSQTSGVHLVGFWHCTPGDGLPHPQQLVTPRWEWRRRRRILRYLRQGAVGLHYMGMSYCRFGCRGYYGTKDLTDSTWVWPEGLEHYVRVHGIRLPDAFVAHMAANGFVVPPRVATFHSLNVSDDTWRAWAAEQAPFRPVRYCYACAEERQPARDSADGPPLRLPWALPGRSLLHRLWYHVGWRW